MEIKQHNPEPTKWVKNETKSSVTQSCPTLWPMECSTPGFPVHHQLPELAQTHIHRVGDAIQLSHPLLSPSPPAFNLSQHQGCFQWVSSAHQVAKILEFQFLHHSFQWIFRTDFIRIDWLDLHAIQGTLKSLLQHHSSILQHSAFLMVQLSYPYMTARKTIALTKWTFVANVMSLLFNMLSTLVIAFLPRSKHLLISWLQSQWFWSPQIKVSLFPFFPHLFAMKWWDQMLWSLFFKWWVLSQLFLSPLSLSSRDSLVPLHFLS